MTTYVFPGQGSQKKGMGSLLFDEFKEITAKADEVLGYSIKDLCMNNIDNCLSLTQYTQPALYTVNALAYYKEIQEMGSKPDYVAGHSLGEYNALLAAGVFDFETGLKLVMKRGELMSRAKGGGMAAVIGLEEGAIKDILLQHQLTKITIANYNSHTQSVIAGPNDEIQNAREIFESNGAMMYVPLKVSGAFHTHYMDSARKEFENHIKDFQFSSPEITVIANFNARPYKTSETRENLVRQITSSVRWLESIEYLLGQGETDFQEIGPGYVLTGLIKRIKRKSPSQSRKKAIADPVTLSSSSPVKFSEEGTSKKDTPETITTLRDLIHSFDNARSNMTAMSVKFGDGYLTKTYGELQSEVKALGNMLLKMGVGRGTKVGILAENRFEWPISYLAVACIGAVNVPLDIFMGAEDLNPVIEKGDVEVIFTSFFMLDKLLDQLTNSDRVQKIICYDNHPQLEEILLAKNGVAKSESSDFIQLVKRVEEIEIKRDIPFKEDRIVYYPSLIHMGNLLLTQGDDPYSSVRVDPDDEVVMIYMYETQFTVLTHHALISNMEGINYVSNPSGVVDKYFLPGEKLLATLPLHHSFPLMTQIIVVLAAYAETVLLTTFKAEEIVETIRDAGISYLPTVPLIIQKIYEEGKKRPLNLDSLKLLISGGASISSDTILGLQSMGIEVCNGYGLSEYSPVVCSNSSSHTRLGSVGKPMKGVEAKIDNPDTDGNGELLVRGPSVMKEYYKMPEKTKEAFASDGWLRTGDIARIDEDGFIFITGRIKKIIVNQGGKNIVPKEIEKILLKSHHISDVSVVPRISYDKGEYPHAIIYPDYKAISDLEKSMKKRFTDIEIRELILNDIQEVTKGRAFYKVPRDVEIVNEKHLAYPTLAERFMFEHHYLPSNTRSEENGLMDSPDDNQDIEGKNTEEHATENNTNSMQNLEIEKYLLSRASKILKLEVSEIDPGKSFLDLFSSVELVQISEALMNDLKIELNPILLFEYPNIEKFSKYLARKYPDHLENYFGKDLKNIEEKITTATTHNEMNPNDKKNPIEESIQKNNEEVSLKKSLTGHHKSNESEPVAIIGMSGIFPGSNNTGEFWSNLQSGVNSITEIPRDRWNWQEVLGDPMDDPDKTNIKWGGFIDATDKFDHLFFSISPREAKVMDPQQRLFLQTAWNTIEDSGYKASDFSGTRTGVFVGVSTSDYLSKINSNDMDVDAYCATGNAFSILPNRVSYLLNLSGPSEAIDTACSSSLYAIHRGVQSIQQGTCDMVIAGGVNLILNPALHIAFGKAGMLSPDGRCKTFDADANGYVRGEGVGAILLKRLSQAEADGDNIYAVIKGSALNHGGKSNSMTAPNPKAQADLIIEAIENAGIHPATLNYIETHGTGTSLGDPVEIKGLRKAFDTLFKNNGEHLPANTYCGLGSVKTNIGHLESAAGIASIIKVLLAIKYKKLPATLHFKSINPYAPMKDSPFYVVDKTIPWSCLEDSAGMEIPRRAGISSFGFGGANAHVIVEEFQQKSIEEVDRRSSFDPAVIVLSAKNEERLKAYVRKMIPFLESQQKLNRDTFSLKNAAYTLQVGRDAMNARLACVVSSLEEWITKFKSFESGDESIENFYQAILSGFSNSSIRENNELAVNSAGYRQNRDSTAENGSSNDLNKIARDWVNGTSIKWSVLNNGERLQRVALPTYPFKPHRHWIETRKTPGTNYIQPEKAKEGVDVMHELKERTIAKNTKIRLKSFETIKEKAGHSIVEKSNEKLQSEPYMDDKPKEKELKNEPPKQLTIAGPVTDTSAHIEEIKHFVADTIGKILHMVSSDIDKNIPLTEFGLDSVGGVEFVNAVNKKYQIDLKAIKLYDYPTIQSFSEHLASVVGVSLSGEEQKHINHMPLENNKSKQSELSKRSPVVSETNAPTVENRESMAIEEFKHFVADTIGKILHMDPSDIDEHIPLTEFGLDSVGGVEFVNAVNKKYQIDLKAIKLYDYPTIQSFSEHLGSLGIGLQSGEEQKSRNLLPLEDNKSKPQELPKRSPLVSEASTPKVENRERIKIKNVSPLSGKQIIQPASDAVNSPDDEDIAIIGMACRLPGSNNIKEYWDNLINGVDSVGEVPSDRWDINQFYHPNPTKQRQTYCKWGGFIDDVDKFDHPYFRTSPAEAELMDPHQRLFMQECVAALDDAGYNRKALSNMKCGVFVGLVNNNEYSDVIHQNDENNDYAYSMLGNANSILSGRIPYFLNLKGPAMAIDTACSSSLVAIHQACKSLQNKEAEMMLAGGALLCLTEKRFITTSKTGALSHTGKCFTFDSRADGYVPGEGVGVIVLKSLSKAIADNDHVYAVIKGSAINQDGTSNGITAPSMESQKELELEAYQKTGINPETITYVEAHGTGTKLGDPIEVTALSECFQTHTNKKQYCALGSVKSNIGHLSASAGVASVIKVALSLKNRQIPPSINFENENEHIQFKDTPFFVNTKARNWEIESNHPRRAATSAFGLSGTNCHMIFEEAPVVQRSEHTKRSPYYLIPVSAKTETAYQNKIMEMKQWLTDEDGDYSIGDLSHTLFAGRDHHPVRGIFIVDDLDQLKEEIQHAVQQKTTDRYHYKNLKKDTPLKRKVLAEFGKHLIQQFETSDALNSPTIQTMEYLDKLTALAELYIDGYELPWETVYPSNVYRRISMPGYSFDKHRHWVQTPLSNQTSSFDTFDTPERYQEAVAELPEKAATSAVTTENIRKEEPIDTEAHPLLHSVEPIEKGKLYVTHLKGDEFYLTDHMLNSEMVLPAMVTVEIVRAAVESAGGRKVSTLRNLIFSSPIVYGEATQKIYTKLNLSDDSAEFEVYTGGGNHAAVTHVQGKADYSDPEAIQQPPEFVDIEAVQGRCHEADNGKYLYELFKVVGLEYGPTFQSIDSLYCNEKEALSKLKLHPDLISDFQKLTLHPVFMDASLQNITGLVKGNSFYTPFVMGAIEIVFPMAKNCYVYAVPTGKGSTRDASVIQFNVNILDENGKVLVRAKRVMLKATGMDVFSQKRNGGAPVVDMEVSKAVINPGNNGGQGKKPIISEPAGELAVSMKEKVLGDLIKMTSSLLKYDIGKMDPHEDILEFGFDSISLTKFSNLINDTYEIEITPALFFDLANPTLDTLSQYLYQDYQNELRRYYGEADAKTDGKSENLEVKQLQKEDPPEVAIQGAEAEEPIRARLMRDLTQMVGTMLKYDSRNIDTKDDLLDLGFDSISLTKFGNQLNDTFDLEITPALFFDLDQPNLHALSEYLYFEYKDNIATYYGNVSLNQRQMETREVKPDASDFTESPDMRQPDTAKGQVVNLSESISEKALGREFITSIKGFKHLLVETKDKEKLEVVTVGKGEPILLISGFGQTAPFWYYQFRDWAQNYQIITVNKPGHGLSEKIKDISTSSISDKIIEVLNQVGIAGPIHIVGASFGANIAHNIARRYPEKVSSLILSNAVYEPKRAFNNINQLVRKDFDRIRQNTTRPQLANDNDKYYKQVMDSSVIDPMIALKYMQENDALFELDSSVRISPSSLILSGKLDVFSSPEETRELQVKMNNSKCVEISDGGHFLNVTHYQDYNKEVVRFIRESGNSIG